MCAVLAVAMHLILTQPLDLRRKIDPEKGEYMVQDLYLARSDEYIVGSPLSGLNTVSFRRCFFLFTIMILAYSIGSCTLWNDWNYFRYFWPTLGMDKGKCGYVGCISGWFWALRVAPRVTDG